jgi:hypothetical protein
VAFVPVTITAGAIDSAELNTNLSRMRKYTNGEVSNTDYATDWVTHRQLMSGTYNGVFNTMNFISGVQGGRVRTAPRQLVTFLSRYNTCRNTAGGLTLANSQFNFIPNTSVILNVPRQLSCMLVHFHIQAVHEDDALSGTVNTVTATSNIQVVLDDEPLDINTINNRTVSSNKIRREFVSCGSIEENGHDIQHSATSNSKGKILKRYPKMGTFLKNDVPAGTWRVALVGKTNGAKVKFVHWSISVEGWL